MFDRFLDTPKGFKALPLVSKYLKYCLNTSKVDMDIIFLLKSHLINYLQIIIFPSPLLNQ